MIKYKDNKRILSYNNILVVIVVNLMRKSDKNYLVVVSNQVVTKVQKTP